MILRVAILIIGLFVAFSVSAQNSRDTGSGTPRPQYNPMDEEVFGPFLPNSKSQAKDYKKRKREAKKRKASSLTYDQAVRDFDKRMKAAAKRYKKEEKLARKPQFSNPLYFGHKRPPKKRPLGKRKLCKECGIVH